MKPILKYTGPSISVKTISEEQETLEKYQCKGQDITNYG